MTYNTSISSISTSVDNYSLLLLELQIDYQMNENYLQIGLPSDVYGWQLYLSAVKSQVKSLLERIIPILYNLHVAFKIVRDAEIAGCILLGEAGYTEMGKIVIIYPSTDHEAIQIINLLIATTTEFKGPLIPNAFRLGGIVFVSAETINFTKKWPFTEIIAQPKPSPQLPKLLNGIYKPIQLLKSDIKGDVIKGLYVKGFLQTAPCVIKEGRHCMWSDDFGRTIEDRLAWQKELYEDLNNYVALPKVLDLFEYDENSYLVTSFIHGVSLDEKIQQLLNGEAFFSISQERKLKLVDYLLSIIQLIETLHNRGVIFRDINPVNFIIDSQENIYLIDLELAYSVWKERPTPAFPLGTPGFASPEQYQSLTPTEKEDIFSLGALMIVFFTGLSPLKFNGKSLKKSLINFIQSNIIIDLIEQCLRSKPDLRPSIQELKQKVLEIKKLLSNNHTSFHSHILQTPPTTDLIQAAVNGLNNINMFTKERLWFTSAPSAQPLIAGQQNRPVITGFYSGIAGILYAIATAKMNGYQTEILGDLFIRNWEYLKNICFKDIKTNHVGLAFGNAGLALVIQQNIASNILKEKTCIEECIEYIKACFQRSATDFGLATGISGQGIALHKCASLNKDQVRLLSEQYVYQILEKQSRNGSWDLQKIPNTLGNKLSLEHGTPGIIIFLLQHWRRWPNNKIEQSIRLALKWLCMELLRMIRRSKKNRLPTSINRWSLGYGIPGMILPVIEGYRDLKEQNYKVVAENMLDTIKPYPVLIDYTQQNGLAGLGEVYIEAYQAFNNQNWLNRAHWIGGIFENTANPIGEDGVYWQTDNRNNATADLLTGNSGIIHFLIRLKQPSKVNGIYT